MSEQYRKNVQAICDKLNIKYPIQEEEVQVAAISFRINKKFIRIEGTEMNRAERIYFQYIYSLFCFPTKKKRFIKCDDPYREGIKHFAELWKDAEEKGRTLISAYAKSSGFIIHWK